MKRNLTLLSLLFFFFSGQSFASDSTSFILKGKIVGKDTGYIYLYYRGINNFISDSFCLQHGAFIFRGNVPEPTGALFSTFNFTSNNRKLYDSKNITEFYIEPGHMTLLANKDSFQLIALEGPGPDNEQDACAQDERYGRSRGSDRLCRSMMF